MTQRKEARGRRSGGKAGRAPASVSLPGWLPWVVWGGVTLLLFREFVVSGRMLFGTDTLSLGYVARQFYADALAEGIFPRWNPLILGGTPFLESLAGGDSLYPPSLLLLFVAETERALGWKLILHVFLAGPFTYGWIRSLGCTRAAAFLSGLAYAVAPFLVTLVYPGHDGKLFVTALTPLLFWAVEAAFRRGTLLRWAGVGAVVALVILTTHFQMAYFLFGGVGAYALFRTVQVWRRGEEGGGTEEGGAGEEHGPAEEGGGTGPRRALSRFGLFAVAALLGAGAAGIQLVPALDYVTEHSRRTATTVQADEAGSVAYSSSWSLHPEEVFALAVPEFVGSNVAEEGWAADTYWGRNPFKLNHEYVGLVVLILAGLSFLGGRRPGLRWFFAGLGSLALLYALGSHTPVWRVFYEVVPGVSLFRAPSMAIFLFGFGAVTLMAFGVDRGLGLAQEAGEGGWRAVFRLLWGAAGLFALFTVLAATGVLTDLWTSLVYRDASEGALAALGRAEPFLVRGAFFATLLAAAVAGVWWAHRKSFLGPTGVVAALAVLLAADGVRVNDPFIQTLDFGRWAAPDENVRYLQERLAEDPPFRIFSMVQGGQDVKPAIYGLELAAGHHPNDLARYRELIGMEGSGAPRNLLENVNVLQILNVRYLLWPELQYGPIDGMERVSETTLRDGRVFRAVYRVPALPRARLVARARVVPGLDAVETILSDAFDPAAEVVLPEAPPVELGGGSVEGEVVWEERSPNRLVLRVRSGEPALLVLAENWFPAWKARVDGDEAPVLRANHTLRAVPVGPGEQRVELRYDSELLRGSLWLSAASVLLLLGGALGTLVGRSRDGRAS